MIVFSGKVVSVLTMVPLTISSFKRRYKNTGSQLSTSCRHIKHIIGFIHIVNSLEVLCGLVSFQAETAIRNFAISHKNSPSLT